MRTRIKICGLRTLEAVQTCVQSGADAVGFVFYAPSPRAVTPLQAKPLALALGPWVTPVALFVNPTVAEVSEVLRAIPNALLQFHGDESPEFCAQFAQPFMKAIRMKEGIDLRLELDRFNQAQGVLVDSWSEHFGGSGHTFDWSLLAEVSGCGVPLILSGGLSDGNVAEAIKQVKPYGVDVSSGVESHRGVKSPEKIVSFCRAVHLADSKTLF
ncbi:MAG: phosphoribosylanthranilate isomerase [Limnobacter sp.]|nr:phosphoribosylanthranilate isomerase [Limnobacter sp.]